ncbi:acyltransferase [Bacillus wiedmannii]|uniref:acyltransferase domain-containing protein n=1 Tax=Bacillus wiedmannii TaxID=1890302 RepID=UPI000BF06AEF|nr:acyltransferase domain-containing protein [Bacillus wiedmannii]PEM85118.1 acyltransferase [Bacillus wiedmannii]PEO82732.1 acyltransferase [Bacillus wiedmannii]
MKNPVVFMFSGQGSHYYQMGRELYSFNPLFREWMDKLDESIFKISGLSVLNTLYNDSNKIQDKFHNIILTHPAIFMTEFSLSQVLIRNGIEPEYVLGVSIGEYASAAVAGVMKIEDVLESVIKQAYMLEQHCQKGYMIAVLGDSDLYYDSPIIYNNSKLAAINYSSHFVISGKYEELKVVEGYMRKKDILFQVLNVDFGFHSSCIDSIKLPYTDFLKTKDLNSPKIPMISSLNGDLVSTIQSDYFWDVIRKPMKFRNAIMNLESIQNYTYIDLGPSGTLATFVKYILGEQSTSEYYSIVTPYNQDMKNLDKVLNYFMSY